VSSEKWRADFREWCIKERDQHLQSAEMLESGVFRLSENYVDISADWAKRNRQIAQEMDDLIAKIDEDIRSVGR
jgi:hypothetical protein